MGFAVEPWEGVRLRAMPNGNSGIRSLFSRQGLSAFALLDASRRNRSHGDVLIHYHGTPIGGTKDEIARFLVGRHALVSFAHPADMGAVAEFCQSFILDNGAFSVWKKGGTLDAKAYVEWVREWYRHPGFDWAIIPDVIEGTQEENDELLYRWPHDVPGCPVFHMHESLDRAHHLANEWAIVSIGSSGAWPIPGTGSWWKRMAKIMEAMTDDLGRPLCKLHGLRMLDPEIFTKLPLSSADSTNAAFNNKALSRFGIYVPPSTSQRAAVIAERIEVHNSCATWGGVEQQEFELSITQITGSEHEKTNWGR